MVQDPIQNIPPQQDILPEQTIVESKKPSMLPKIILVVLGIVFLVGVALGAYYLGAKQAAQKVSDRGTSAENTTSQVIQKPTVTPDPTANWAVYTNAKYSYSIKYPQGLTPNEQNTYYHYVEFKNTAAAGQLPPYLVSVIPDTFVVKDIAAYNYMSSDWIGNISNMAIGDTKQMDSAATYTRLMDMNIDGVDSVSIKVQATGFNQVRTYVKKNGYIYMIANYYQNPDSIADYSLFASSFKFANAAADISNWKTYSGNGFNFKYPNTWVTPANTPNSTQYVWFVDPATGTHTGNGGGLIYGDSIMATVTQTSESVESYVDNIKLKQISALANEFQTKAISLNGQEAVVYHQGGEGSVGWYIPFANGKQIVDFGPLGTDPAQNSIELQIIQTFKFSQ